MTRKKNIKTKNTEKNIRKKEDVNTIDDDLIEEDQEVEEKIFIIKNNEEKFDINSFSTEKERELIENARMISKKCHQFITNEIFDENDIDRTVNNLTALLSSSIYYLINLIGLQNAANVVNMSYGIGQKAFFDQLKESYPGIDKKKLH